MAREHIKAQSLTDSHDRIVMVENAQNHIHNGEMFRVNAVFSLGVSGTRFALIRTGSTPVHIYGDLTASGASKLNFYEAPTTTADGTPATVLNKRRDSTNTSNVLAFDSPTVTANGTLLDPFILTGTINAGGKDRSQNEWSLSANTDYLIEVFATAASDYTLKFEFYEETLP